jgi:predicted hotdog family 3-hydroxylacyl-ACP dehydratase
MTAVPWSLDQLLPHAGPMVLLDEVLAIGDETVRAVATVRRDGLFAGLHEPGVPACVGMEYLAQAIAAWSGFHERARDRPVRPGYLVGARSFHSSAGTIPYGVVLTIEAERLMEDGEGIGVFDGHVTGAGVEQTVRLKVYLPGDPDRYWAGQPTQGNDQ